jgi:hypothetical protein
MVVDVKLFTIEKLYHLDSLTKISNSLLPIKATLIDRAHSNDSNSAQRIFSLSAVGKRRSPYRLFPDLIISPSPSHRIHDGDDEADETTRATHSTTIVVQAQIL